MSAESSRYACTHKDSRTKPLHDATAQMAVDAQMQRLDSADFAEMQNQQSKQR